MMLEVLSETADVLSRSLFGLFLIINLCFLPLAESFNFWWCSRSLCPLNFFSASFAELAPMLVWLIREFVFELAGCYRVVRLSVLWLAARSDCFLKTFSDVCGCCCAAVYDPPCSRIYTLEPLCCCFELLF